MSQHFLLSAAARTLSLKKVYRGGEDKAYAMFRKFRWPQTDGAPVCPRCGGLDAYEFSTRRKAEHQTGKRRVVIVFRQRKGRTLTAVVRSEADGVAFIPGPHRSRRCHPRR